MFVNKDCVISRAVSLAVGEHAEKIINAVIAGVESQNTAPRVFRDIDDFFENVLFDFINEEIFHHEAVNTASAETNAYFSDSFVELADDPDLLSTAVSTWDVPIVGVVNMDQDPDRMFFGNKIKFAGAVRMKKVGKVCLAADVELDIYAAVDDGYDDRADFHDNGASEMATVSKELCSCRQPACRLLLVSK